MVHGYWEEGMDGVRRNRDTRDGASPEMCATFESRDHTGDRLGGSQSSLVRGQCLFRGFGQG